MIEDMDDCSGRSGRRTEEESARPDANIPGPSQSQSTHREIEMQSSAPVLAQVLVCRLDCDGPLPAAGWTAGLIGLTCCQPAWQAAISHCPTLHYTTDYKCLIGLSPVYRSVASLPFASESTSRIAKSTAHSGRDRVGQWKINCRSFFP